MLAERLALLAMVYFFMYLRLWRLPCLLKGEGGGPPVTTSSNSRRGRAARSEPRSGD